MSESEFQNRYAPPEAVVADDLGSGLVLGGRGERLAAAVVDGVLVLVVSAVAIAAFGLSFSDVLSSRRPGVGIYGWFIPAWLISLGIQGWFLYTRSQSIGKILLKIRVVRSDGSRVSFPRLFFGRMGCMALLSAIPVLGRVISLVDALLIFRSSRMCLHDQLFDTRVVTAASSEKATLAGARGETAGLATSA